jgi:hypothetical protein
MRLGEDEARPGWRRRVLLLRIVTVTGWAASG